MNTPQSDAALARWAEYTDRVHTRLKNGRITYGDSSFERPILSLVEELRQEVEDIAGWGFVLWCRLDALERLILTAPPPSAP